MAAAEIKCVRTGNAAALEANPIRLTKSSAVRGAPGPCPLHGPNVVLYVVLYLFGFVPLLALLPLVEVLGVW